MKLVDKLENKDRIKVLLLLLLLYIIYININKQLFESREMDYFSETGTTKFIQITDQMFEPLNLNMPDQMHHSFTRNYPYEVVEIFIDKSDSQKKLKITNSNNHEYVISLGSIKYPKDLIFSKNKCYVLIDSLYNNEEYVFFSSEKLYSCIANNDTTYVVLDNNRNQVTLNENQITPKRKRLTF